jgi:hypothetical protein
LILARDKILKEEHINDPATIVRLLLKHKRSAIQKMKICWTIEREFLNEATGFWKRGKKKIAIVLYTSAVEQLINSMYQMVFEARGLDSEASTQLVRSLSIEAKLGWLFRSYVGHKFPEPLGQRLRRVFEIRNAIVHFKAIPGRLDYDEDSGSKLNEALKGLRHMSLSRDFRLLETTFEEAVLKTDPNRALALKAAQAINDYKEAA